MKIVLGLFGATTSKPFGGFGAATTSQPSTSFGGFGQARGGGKYVVIRPPPEVRKSVKRDEHDER